MRKAVRSSLPGRAKAAIVGLGEHIGRVLAVALAVAMSLAMAASPTTLAPALRALPSRAPVLARPPMTSPMLANPPANVPRTPAMAQACSGDDAPACQAAVVQAIDHARAAEGVGPLVLPSDFGSLSTSAQLLVLADLERTDRGLPGFSGLSASLDSLAARGASANTDPSGPSNADWGSNWAGGEQNALLADYDWMYDDGPGSPNLDCPKPGSSGCWDHRENILWDYGPHPSMGAAATKVDGVTSMAEIFSSSPAGALEVPLPAGTGVAAASRAVRSTSTGPALAPQRALRQGDLSPRAAARADGALERGLQTLALPAEAIPLRLEVDGVPATPVTRLIRISSPISGFGPGAPFRR